MPDESEPNLTEVMFIRPHNCTYCGNGFYAMAHVVQYARARGYGVADLFEAMAEQQEVYFTLHQQNPQGIFGFGHGCYDEESKILTEEGWKYFPELHPGMKVATLNKGTGELEYQEPQRYIGYEYEGKMFYQKAKGIDLLVTPDHNLYVSWQINQGKEISEFNFLKPSEMLDAHKTDGKTGRFIKNRETTVGRLRFKRDAIWIGEEQKFFVLPAITYDHRNQYSDKVYKKVIPEQQIKMDYFLDFFGWWLAEGCACLGYADKNKKYINYRVSLTQNNNEKRKKLRDALDKLGFKYQETGDAHSTNLEIRNKQLYSYLKQFGHSGDKFIPKEIKKLCPRQLKILFGSMMLGDGHYQTETSFTYFTKSKRLAEDVQEICLKMGYASSMTWGEGVYRVNVVTEDTINPLCRKDQRGWIDYSGMVYCVEVPNNIIYVQRNGKSCWCGNSTYRFTGDSQTDIFNMGNTEWLDDRLVYLLSCQTGSVLGQGMVTDGADSFAGYTEDWTWACEGGTEVDPYEDKYGKCFFESANQLWISLLDGKSFGVAYQDCLNKYDEWITYWLNSGDMNAGTIVGYLAGNRNSLVLYGNTNAKLGFRSTCDEYENVGQTECEGAGCSWWPNGLCRLAPPPEGSCLLNATQEECETAGCVWLVEQGYCHHTLEMHLFETVLLPTTVAIGLLVVGSAIVYVAFKEHKKNRKVN